jgi:hypothetical protein
MPGPTRRDLLALAAGAVVPKAQEAGRCVYLSLDDARAVLRAFPGELPSGIESATPSAARWLDWETSHDREIRTRLERGDADSIINFVLFGASFTTQPRITGKQTEAADSEAVGRLILARVQDFTEAVMRPGRNERLQFAADWLDRNGVNFSAAEADKRIRIIVVENCRRVLREQRQYAASIAEAKRKGDAASLFVARSALYRERGLSLDTSFRPNIAVERSLAEMQKAGMLSQVRRAAVIGPGLDFTDKRSGYDFYPVQTLQPFALIDSLRRLKLAEHAGPRVCVFDLSERVLSHVRRAATQAREGASYTVEMPLDGETRWLPETVAYWRQFGAEIGAETQALSAPPGVDVRMRAVRVGPGTAALLEPAGLDIVTQHLALAEDRKIDLAIATNVLVYYSPFEQALALRNVAAMLRKGGVLLSNNALPEEGTGMRPVGATSVAYSDDADDGDHVVWYQRW